MEGDEIMIKMSNLIKQRNIIRKETGMIKEENESLWTWIYKGMLGGFNKAGKKGGQHLEDVAKASAFLVKTEFGRGAKNDFIKEFKKNL